MLMTEHTKKNVRREIGKYFRRSRMSSGLSQKETALKVGITPQYLSNFENGRSTLSLDFIKKLISLYKISSENVIQTYLQITKHALEEDFKIIKSKKSKLDTFDLL